MIVLTVRTDKPEAELAVYDGARQIAELRWEAHRKLAETIHAQIDAVIESANISIGDIQGIACYKGPGSFTGLRIGLTVANTLAAIHALPIVIESGVDWQREAIEHLQAGINETVALPEYGAPATTTTPKK